MTLLCGGRKMEAGAGFEPANRAFAEPRLGPLGHPAERDSRGT